MQSRLEFEVKNNEFDSMGNLNSQFEDFVMPSKTT